MRIPLCVLALAVCLNAACAYALADDATAPAATAPHGGWVFSGLADGYLTYNGNSPAMDLNALQNFDLHSGAPRLSLAKFTMDKSDKVFGLHLDVGAGETMRLIHAADPAALDHKALRYLEQMYLTFKPVDTRGTEIDFGQFVTSAGAEVIESSSNWNYTRSLLFAWAVPYYHFGFRSSTPITKEFTVGFQLTNAWNTVWGNNNFHNVAFTAALTRPKFAYSVNYLGGPNHIGTSEGKRNLLDTTLVLTPNSKLSFYVNGDWARDNQPGGGHSQWYGLAGAARYQLTKLFALAARTEFLNDPKGYATGSAQLLKETTGTFEYKINSWLVARLEARHDNSNHAFFDHGSGKPLTNSENTVTLGLMALVGPRK